MSIMGPEISIKLKVTTTLSEMVGLKDGFLISKQGNIHSPEL